jgi:hypothetical protein
MATVLHWYATHNGLRSCCRRYEVSRSVLGGPLRAIDRRDSREIPVDTYTEGFLVCEQLEARRREIIRAQRELSEAWAREQAERQRHLADIAPAKVRDIIDRRAYEEEMNDLKAAEARLWRGGRC